MLIRKLETFSIAVKVHLKHVVICILGICDVIILHHMTRSLYLVFMDLNRDSMSKSYVDHNLQF